jgi:hypothetical protein
LGEVPQGEVLRLERLLEGRPEHPGLDPDGEVRLVDLDDAVEPGQVQGDPRGRAPVLDAADDRRAAAVRDDRRVARLGPVEDGDHVVRGARERHEIRRVVEATVQRPYDVSIGLPIGVSGPRHGVRGEGLFEDRRRDQPRPVQDRIVGDRRDRPVDRHPRPERALGELEARLVVVGLVGPAPTPPRAFPPPAHDEAACHTIPYGVRRAR